MKNTPLSLIKQQLAQASDEQIQEILSQLKTDQRAGAQKLFLSYQRMKALEERKSQKKERMCYYEKNGWRNGALYIGGMDEAGRGPLAGPVVAACCVLTEIPDIEGIDDSKKLTASCREKIFAQIQEAGISYGIGLADHQEIDRDNILQATFLAMRRALADLRIKPHAILVDGNFLIPQIDIPQKCIIQGDQKCLSVAIASIIAKVTRDQVMEQYGELYPGYGFEQHKGYGTFQHRQAILEKGPAPIHRLTFLRKTLEILPCE